MSEDFLQGFLPRHDAAHTRFVAGDPEPWLALWSHTEPVSAFGGFGYISEGRDQVEAIVRKASARLSGGTYYRNEVLSAQVVGDVAYTAAIERSVASTDRGAPVETSLRVTQIYRFEDEQWRIAHRHGDIIPPEQLGSR